MSDDYETHELELAFQAGATSRDAEIEVLQSNQANVEETHKLTLREVQRELMRLQTERDQLRAQFRELLATTTEQSLAEYRNKVIEAFVNEFSRHVGGDGEFWLHELQDFAMKEQP